MRKLDRIMLSRGESYLSTHENEFWANKLTNNFPYFAVIFDFK